MSRYYAPGTVVDRVSDNGTWGKAVVIATSRHKVTCGEREARVLLAAAIDGPHTEPEFEHWYLVVRSDLDRVDTDEGGWHSEATGAAWTTVLWANPAGRGEA